MQQHTSLNSRSLFRMRTVRSLRTLTSITLAFSFFITPLAPIAAQEASAPAPEQTAPAEQTPAVSEQTPTQSETPDTKGKKPDATTPDTLAPANDKKDDKQKDPKKPTEPPVEPDVSAQAVEVGATTLLDREAMRPQAKTNVSR